MIGVYNLRFPKRLKNQRLHSYPYKCTSSNLKNLINCRPLNNDGHFSSGRSNRPSIGGGAGGGNSSLQQQQQKDRKMKRSDDRPRHIRSSMDR
jgi:hypothetical protein